MKKHLLILTVVSLIISCGESEEKSSYEYAQEVIEDNNIKNNFAPKDPAQPGSNKAMIIGNWKSSDSDIRIEITKDRYYTYDGSHKAWDQDWELTTSDEYSIPTKDDNGTFLHVLDDEGNSFYYVELVDVQDGYYTGYVRGKGDLIEYEPFD